MLNMFVTLCEHALKHWSYVTDNFLLPTRLLHCPIHNPPRSISPLPIPLAPASPAILMPPALPLTNSGGKGVKI